MLVFDNTNLESFQNLGEWYGIIKKGNQNKALPGMNIQNKILLS